MPKETVKDKQERFRRAIQSGGSVLLSTGRVITKVEDIPDAVDLAKGDVTQTQFAVEDLDAQIAALQAKKAKAEPVKTEEAKTEEAPSTSTEVKPQTNSTQNNQNNNPKK